MARRREELAALGASALAVGFSPPPALADLAEYLAWPWPFLSDPERRLYQRLGLGRVALHRVYSAGTLLRYAQAALGGQPIRRPVEDTRQMGGDAIVREGVVLGRFSPRSPDDRAPVTAILRSLRASAAGEISPGGAGSG